MRYPTAADATAAGYHLIAGFGPGSGAHYIGFGGGGLRKPMGLIPEALLRPDSPDEKQGINNRSHGAMRGNQNDTRRIPLRYNDV